MDKTKAALEILEQIHVLGIEKEIYDALSGYIVTHPKRTSNGFEIYYDESSGEAVGIVYKNLVFFKNTSPKEMTWREAVSYCRHLCINGIVAGLCPLTEDFEEEFVDVSYGIYKALAEIGAQNLGYWSWSAKSFKDLAWAFNFGLARISYYVRDNIKSYARPVLVLKK